MNAEEKYERAVAKNEALEEKLDVLYKLGRSYLNQNDELRKKVVPLPPPPDSNTDQEVTTVQIKTTEGVWTSSKLGGFRQKQVHF